MREGGERKAGYDILARERERERDEIREREDKEGREGRTAFTRKSDGLVAVQRTTLM